MQCECLGFGMGSEVGRGGGGAALCLQVLKRFSVQGDPCRVAAITPGIFSEPSEDMLRLKFLPAARAADWNAERYILRQASTS